MSDATSENPGKRYGLQRVCRAWERARSSVYARVSGPRSVGRARDRPPARRGPKPKHTNATGAVSPRSTAHLCVRATSQPAE